MIQIEEVKVAKLAEENYFILLEFTFSQTLISYLFKLFLRFGVAFL
jgi:hypothetical protein